MTADGEEIGTLTLRSNGESKESFKTLLVDVADEDGGVAMMGLTFRFTAGDSLTTDRGGTGKTEECTTLGLALCGVD